MASLSSETEEFAPPESDTWRTMVSPQSVPQMATPQPEPLMASPVLEPGVADLPQELDFGIYFFGPNHTARKFRKGQANPFFSGTKPLMLFVHGWSGFNEGGHSPRSANETFTHDGFGCSCHPEADLMQAWIEKGWDVAAFFWDNFAEETLHLNVESKIWTSQGPVGMRYPSSGADGGFATKGAPDTSGAVLLREALEEVMADCQDGVQLRLIGHSMGSQMALRASYLLAERVEQGLAPRRYLPSRIALLDPYWSPKAAWINSQEWLGKVEETHGSEDVSTASLSLEFASFLAKRFGILLEIYTSCHWLITGLGDSNPVGELVSRGHAAVVHLRPNYCHVLDWPGRHLSALGMYLWSMTFDPRRHASSATTGTPSAAMSDRQLKLARGSEWVEAWEEKPGVDYNPTSVSFKHHEAKPSREQHTSLHWTELGKSHDARADPAVTLPRLASVPAAAALVAQTSSIMKGFPFAAPIGVGLFLGIGCAALAVFSAARCQRRTWGTSPRAEPLLVACV